MNRFDARTFKGERQQAPDLEGIHPGHLERYFFASRTAEGTVLDAACGCGYGSKIMQDAGSFVTGIDLEKEAIDYARKFYPGPEYFLADVTKYSGKYDWVVSFETIEHLKDPLSALKQFRKSRRLIVSTPNEEKYPFDPRKFVGDKFPHIRHFSPDELDGLLKEAGWIPYAKFCQQGKVGPVEEGTDGHFLIFCCI